MKILTSILPRFTLASLCALTLAAPSFVNGANLVQNSSFEDNSSGAPLTETAPLTFWTVAEVLGTGGANQNLVNGLNSTVFYQLPPHTGVIDAAFRSTTNTVTTGGLATLSQTLTTTVAQAYELTFWLANPIQDPSNLNNIFSVSWNGVALALSSPSLSAVGGNQYIVAPNTAWFQVTASNLVGTGSDVLKFSARNSDYATLLDDVVVQASGVPDSGSTIAMFGIALAGLVLVSRKTQRAELA
jgi:hypothetical protein